MSIEKPVISGTIVISVRAIICASPVSCLRIEKTSAPNGCSRTMLPARVTGGHAAAELYARGDDSFLGFLREVPKYKKEGEAATSAPNNRRFVRN
jgi:hypothetical protein